MPGKRKKYYRHSHGKQSNLLSLRTVKIKYGLTKEQIEKYFPKPHIIHPKNPEGRDLILWDENEIKSALSDPEIKKAIEAEQEAQKKEAELRKCAVEYLTSFSPESLIRRGKQLNRRFIFHVGETNSGKTYTALQDLKKASSGVYLGPLRLLALEMFDTINRDGVLCSLLTGEEREDVPFSNITASTIELADFSEHYSVAVIDEAQMIADPSRGDHWARAICCLNADRIHVCMAPEALKLITSLVTQMGASYEVCHHERLVPLVWSGSFRKLNDVQPGDALIAFSRKQVLNIAAQLSSNGVSASVIYGALPPAARREEVRRFAEKETAVVVATDAIGMGISLPIRRVIFCSASKFDGTMRRPLLPQEIKQIAGRAGRYGKYDLGEVLSMSGSGWIDAGLMEKIPDIEKISIPFPKESLSGEFPLEMLLHEWNRLPEQNLFSRSDMSESETLYKSLKPRLKGNEDISLLYTLTSCPVDTHDRMLVEYWTKCAGSILHQRPIAHPTTIFRDDTLEGCEQMYKAYDVYHQLLRRIGQEDDCLEEKSLLCEKINSFLKDDDKSSFYFRCKKCGRIMPVTESFGLCSKCFRTSY